MRSVAVLALAMTSAGCFMPPPLELEADGGGTNAPQVLLGISNPAIGSTVTRCQTAAGETELEPLRFNIALRDVDSSKLYVRLFIGPWPYDSFIASRDTNDDCTLGCSVVLEVKGFCDDVVNNVVGTYYTEAYIVDQPWSDEDVQDARKTLPGGFTTVVNWRVQCKEPGECPSSS